MFIFSGSFCGDVCETNFRESQQTTCDCVGKTLKEVSGSEKVVYMDKTDFSNPDHSKKYLYP